MTEVTKKLSKVYAFVLLLFVLVIGSVPAQAQVFYPPSFNSIFCSTQPYAYFYRVPGATSYKVQFSKGSTSLASGAFEYSPVYRTTVTESGYGYNWVRMPCEEGWGSSRVRIYIRAYNSSGQEVGTRTVSELKFAGNANIKAPPRSVTARPGQGIVIQNEFEPGEAPTATPSPVGSLAYATIDFAAKPRPRAFNKERFNQCVRMRMRVAKAKRHRKRFTKRARFTKRQETMRRCKDLSTDSSLTPVQVAHASSCGGTFCLSVEPNEAPPYCVSPTDPRSILKAFDQNSGTLSWTSIPDDCRGYIYHLGFEGVNLVTGIYETERAEFRAVNASGVPPAQLDDIGGKIIPSAYNSQIPGPRVEIGCSSSICSAGTDTMGRTVDGPANQIWADEGTPPGAGDPRAPLYQLTIKLNPDNKLFDLKELLLVMGNSGSHAMKRLTKMWYSDSATLPTTWSPLLFVQTYLEDLDNFTTVPQSDLDEGEGSRYRIPFGATGISARWLKLEFGDTSGSLLLPFVAEIDFFGEEVAGGVTPPAGTAIANCAQLQALNNPTGNYYLANDIDCNDPGISGNPSRPDCRAICGRNTSDGKGFRPITLALDTNPRFVFDGKGFSISNLYINRPNEDNVGLFSNTRDSHVTFKNLNLINATVTGRHYVGVLFGGYESGWFPEYDAVIEGVNTSGTVSGISRVGGIAGTAAVARISGSGSTANVTAAQDAGGLVGTFGTGNIEDSYATGSVQASSTTAGGLVGYMMGSANIRRSFSRGGVTGGKYAGGLVGATGVAWDSYVPTIEDSFFAGTVIGTEELGGIAGKVQTTGNIIRSYSVGMVRGYKLLGGLVGVFGSGQIQHSITGCSVFDSDSGPGLDPTVGAVVGKLSSGPGGSLFFADVLGDAATVCVGSGSPVSASCTAYPNGLGAPFNSWNTTGPASIWLPPISGGFPQLRHSIGAPG